MNPLLIAFAVIGIFTAAILLAFASSIANL